jgi:hypothetical protein
MMFAGKDATAEEMVELRVCVAPRNKNSFARDAGFVPQHCHTMSGVLAIQSYTFGNKPRTDMLKPYQTDARHCIATVQLGPEARRQLLLLYLRINAEVCQDSSADYTLNNRQFHGTSNSFGATLSGFYLEVQLMQNRER